MAYFKCKGDVGKNPEYLYKWDFTKSLTDEVQGITATLVWNASQDSTGVHFLHALDAMNMSPNPINMNGKTIEIDIASFVFAGQNNSHVRFIMNMPSNTERGNGTGMLIRKYQDLRWNAYLPNSQATSTGWGSSWNIQDSDLNGHTLKMSCENDNKLSMWIDDQLVDTKQDDYTYLNSTNCNYLRIGGLGESKGHGDQCYNMTITGIRIYNNHKPKPKPKKLLLVDWDFTQSLTDSIMGETVRIDNATFVQGEGIKSNSNSTWGNVIAFTQKDFNFEGKTVEIDFSKLTIEDDGAYDHSLILIHHLTGEYGENISTFMPNPNWKANLRNQAQLYNETTSITNFEDCTFKFVFTNGNMLVTVDDNVLYDGGTIVDGLSSWQIGHNWGEFIVTGMRIYTNE